MEVARRRPSARLPDATDILPISIEEDTVAISPEGHVGLWLPFSQDEMRNWQQVVEHAAQFEDRGLDPFEMDKDEVDELLADHEMARDMLARMSMQWAQGAADHVPDRRVGRLVGRSA